MTISREKSLGCAVILLLCAAMLAIAWLAPPFAWGQDHQLPPGFSAEGQPPGAADNQQPTIASVETPMAIRSEQAASIGRGGPLPAALPAFRLAASVVSRSPECGECPGGGAITQARHPGDYDAVLPDGRTVRGDAHLSAPAPQGFLSVPAGPLTPVAMKATASSPPVPVRGGLWEAVRRLCEEYYPGTPSTGLNRQTVRPVEP